MKYLSFEMTFDFFFCGSLFLFSEIDYSADCARVSRIPNGLAIFCIKFTLIVFFIIIIFLLILHFGLKCNLFECSCMKLKILLMISTSLAFPYMLIIFVINLYGNYVATVNNAFTIANIATNIFKQTCNCCK